MRVGADIIGIWLVVAGLMVPKLGSAADLDVTLQMILDAPKTVDYEGILTTQRFGAEEEPVFHMTQRVAHQHPDKNRIDSIDPSTLEKTVVVQIKYDAYWRETRGDSTRYTHRRRQGDNVVDLGLGFSSLDLLQTNYGLTIQGNDTILKRPAVKLAISPKHPGRNSKTAWVDRATGLVLRTESRDEQGKLLEEVFFSRITINPKLDAALFSTDEWKDRTVEVNQVIACGSMQEVEKEAGFALAAPVFIPAGFTLDHLRVIRYWGQPMAHFTYTDGLAQISLYQRVASPTDKAARAFPGGVPETFEDVQFWKRSGDFPYSILRLSHDSKLFTMISDVSDEESLQMIKSLCVIKSTTSGDDSAAIYWFTGGGVLVGCLVLGGWLIRSRRAIF